LLASGRIANLPGTAGRQPERGGAHRNRALDVSFTDVPVVMDCQGESLLGIVSRPETAGALGLVMLVGGPQYRVGSHRQFLLLARCLADAGFPVLRFDYRGMGDSSGEVRHFEVVDDDIGVAIDALRRTCPSVERVVLWGLCDAASAALLYSGQHPQAGLAGLCLLNPWVRSETTLARTHIKHYYVSRLLQPEFWRSIWQGQYAWRSSARGLWQSLRAWRPSPQMVGSEPTFQQRMARALRNFNGPVLLLLSGGDYTAKEFLECALTDRDWRGLLQRPGLSRVDVAQADHTFSKAVWRAEVEQAVLSWMTSLDASA
jgi:exosortase A-associated hydrolase 1